MLKLKETRLIGKETSNWDRFNGIEFYNIEFPEDNHLSATAKPYIVRNSVKHYKILLFIIVFLYAIMIMNTTGSFEKSFLDVMESFNKRPFSTGVILLILIILPSFCFFSILNRSPKVTITNSFIQSRSQFIRWVSVQNMYIKHYSTNHGRTFSLVVEKEYGSKCFIDFYGLEGTPKQIAEIIGRYYYLDTN